MCIKVPVSINHEKKSKVASINNLKLHNLTQTKNYSKIGGSSVNFGPPVVSEEGWVFHHHSCLREGGCVVYFSAISGLDGS